MRSTFMNLWITLLFISLVDLIVVSSTSAYCETDMLLFLCVLFKLLHLIYVLNIGYSYDIHK